MPGLFGVFSEKAGSQCATTLMGPLDKLGLCDTKSLRDGDTALMGVAWHKNAPIRESRCFEDQDWMIALAGDVVTIEGRKAGPTPPWDDVVKSLAGRDYHFFASWVGIYCICAYNKKSHKVYMVSDKRSMQPIFYAKNKDGFFVSTDLPWFKSLPLFETGFSTEWLWEHMFFNYGIFERTGFLKDVWSVLPASVMEYDASTGEMTSTRYADIFTKKEHLLSGRKAHRRALEVFGERFPLYYWGADPVNCALTSGWDTRTVLTFRPSDAKVETYTYGIPGCEDLSEAQRISSLIGVPHRTVEFDPRFVSKLRSFFYYAVWLSAGRQSISRSTLAHAYRTVTDAGTRLPVTLSGMGGDLFFRSDWCVPTPVAFEMATAFVTGATSGDSEFWKVLLGNQHKGFAEYVDDKLKRLEKNYGPFKDTEHHLRYVIYEAGPKYWAGEHAIAGNFTTLRSPFFDDDILAMDFEISEGVLGVSCFGSKWGKYKDWVLQAYMIAHTDAKLAEIPVRGVPPKMAQYGFLAKAPYKLARRVPMKLKGQLHAVPLENWKGWLENEAKPAIDELIYSKEARIRQYMNPDALSLVPPKEALHYTMWLTTAEIILRLMESDWVLPEEILNDVAE